MNSIYQEFALLLMMSAVIGAIVACDEAEAARLPHLDQIEIIHPFNQAADFAAIDLAARIASAEFTPAKEST